MKRELDPEPLQVTSVAFFAQARDLIAHMTWQDEPVADLTPEEHWQVVRQDLVRGLRSLMTTSKELNRVLVLDASLWQQLLGALQVSRGQPLSVLRLDVMEVHDLAILSSQAYSPDRLMTYDLSIVGEIRGGLPLHAYAETALNLLFDTFRRLNQDALLVTLRTQAADPVRWWLELLRSVLRRDTEMAGVSALFRAIPGFRPTDPFYLWRATGERFLGNNAVSLRGKWYGLDAWLDRQLLGWNPEGSAKAQTLFWRTTLRYSSRTLQEPDSVLTLVPLEDLPQSYLLFWFVLVGARSPPNVPQRHRMFHACVACERELSSDALCCWLRDEPSRLYCNAQCFAQVNK